MDYHLIGGLLTGLMVLSFGISIVVGSCVHFRECSTTNIWKPTSQQYCSGYRELLKCLLTKLSTCPLEDQMSDSLDMSYHVKDSWKKLCLEENDLSKGFNVHYDYMLSIHQKADACVRPNWKSVENFDSLPDVEQLEIFCSNYKLLNDCFVSTFEKECGLETRAVTVEFVKTVVAGNEKMCSPQRRISRKVVAKRYASYEADKENNHLTSVWLNYHREVINKLITN